MFFQEPAKPLGGFCFPDRVRAVAVDQPQVNHLEAARPIHELFRQPDIRISRAGFQNPQLFGQVVIHERNPGVYLGEFDHRSGWVFDHRQDSRNPRRMFRRLVGKASNRFQGLPAAKLRLNRVAILNPGCLGGIGQREQARHQFVAGTFSQRVRPFQERLEHRPIAADRRVLAGILAAIAAGSGGCFWPGA